MRLFTLGLAGPCPHFSPVGPCPAHTYSAVVASVWDLLHKLAQIAMAETQWHLRPQNPANPVVFFGACMAAAHINIIRSRPRLSSVNSLHTMQM